jgi:hypothetical protein
MAQVPYTWPKEQGFNFLPPGTAKQYDAGKWALYYNPLMGASFIVIDFDDHWKINHYLGKMVVKYAQGYMAGMPCCGGA